MNTDERGFAPIYAINLNKRISEHLRLSAFICGSAPRNLRVLGVFAVRRQSPR
jgi:hypothetical protein